MSGSARPACRAFTAKTRATAARRARVGRQPVQRVGGIGHDAAGGEVLGRAAERAHVGRGRIEGQAYGHRVPSAAHGAAREGAAAFARRASARQGTGQPVGGGGGRSPTRA